MVHDDRLVCIGIALPVNHGGLKSAEQLAQLTVVSEQHRPRPSQRPLIDVRVGVGGDQPAASFPGTAGRKHHAEVLAGRLQDTEHLPEGPGNRVRGVVADSHVVDCGVEEPRGKWQRFRKIPLDELAL